MKIAYIVPKLARRGPIIVVHELVLQMRAHGHECTVFYLDEGPDELGFPSDCKLISLRGKNANKLDFRAFDVVHSHGLRPDVYVFLHKPWRWGANAQSRRQRANHAANAQSRQSRANDARNHAANAHGGDSHSNNAPKPNVARCISTLHNYLFKDLGFQYNRFVAFFAGLAWLLALRRHDKLIALSRDAVAYYSRFLPKKKLTYAYNTRHISEDETAPNAAPPAADTAAQTTATDIDTPSTPYLIGIHAELTELKGIDQLLRVLPHLKDHGLVVIGEGPARRELEQLCTTLGISKRVRFLGKRPHAHRYLSLYDLYALPSRSEGFPLVLLEAAAAKKAVVCSKLPIFQELLTENEVAFFEIENLDALQAAILHATAHKTELGQRLHERYLSTFSPEHFYHRHIEIYESL